MNCRAPRPLRRSTFFLTLLLVIAFAPSRLGAFQGSPRLPEPGTAAALLAKVIPTVVAIHVRRNVSDTDRKLQASLAVKIQRAEGSGFIVSSDGFIATNKHVVHGAYDVAVALHDGRTIDARIVWESTVVDVAFLKIDTDRPLQAATLSREDKLELGRPVIAVGNPLGLGISASSGIVSAVDRDLKQSPYDNYVQTDAAINFGNSGGPLFDLDGLVVGMNSILWTVGKDQGSQGLGFAIPGADISFLIDQLRAKGRIECGTLGVRGQRLTPAMGEAMDYPGVKGVIVATIEPDSPGAEAGLRLGDILESFDGKKLDDATTFNRATCLALGHTARIAVWRDGRPLSLAARVKEAEDGKVELARMASILAPRLASAHDLGLSLAPLDKLTRRMYRIGDDVHGFVVLSVADSSEANNAGLVAGDVITSLQMTPLTGDEPFDVLFSDQGRNGRRHVILLVQAKGGERWITFPVRLTGPS